MANLVPKVNNTGSIGTSAKKWSNVHTTTLSVGAQAADLSLNSQKITNLATPTASTDAANKAYVDDSVQGLSSKDSVRAATTANGTLASAFANSQAIDGVTLATGDRVLLKNQTAGAENGIYTVNASGAPTRAVDFDSNAEVAKGAFIFVEEGTSNANAGFVLTTDGAITLGTTALAFTQFSGAGQITAGDGLTKSGNTLSVDIPGSAEMTGDVADADELLISDGGTLKRADFSVVRDAVFTDVSGDATVAAGGALSLSSVSITGQTAETSIADDDLILISDTSDSGALRKMTKANFVSGLGGGGLANVVEDTTPQLGGALDVNGKDIVTLSNGNITLTPNGSGVVRIDGTAGIDLQSGEIAVKNSGSVSNIKLYCETGNAHYTQIQSAAHASYSGNVTLTLPVATGTLVGSGDSGTVTNTMLAGSIANGKLVNAAVTVTAGDGLSGGGSVALGATTSLALDLNELTAAVVDVAADSIVIVDADDSNSSKKESVADLVAGVAGTGLSASSGQLSIDGTVTTLAGSQTLTNKTLTSAVLNTGVSGTAVLDEDNMSSNSATKLATQQSIKAYVDAQVAGGGLDIDGYSALGGTGLHQTQDHFVFSDNGSEKKITFSNLEDAIFANISGDTTIAAGGALTIAADAVTYAKMQNVSATDKLLGRSTSGAGVIEEISCTAAGRALLDDADAAAQRTTLGLGTGDSPTLTSLTLSGQAAALAMNSQKITGLATPTADADAATKSYVDGVAQGLSAKDSVRAATTANGTLSSAFANSQAIDGVTLATGDRILLKNQSTATQNGIYTVNASGAPTRAVDFDSNAEVAKGAFIFVEEGTTNADAGFVLTTDGAITLGSTSLAFTQFSGAGDITAGSALTKSGNTLNVAVDDSSIEVSSDALRVKASGVTSAMLAGSIANSKLNTISTANKVALTALDLDGGTDIGADLVDADLVVVDDGADGTNRKSALSRMKKYIFSAVSGDATASDAGALTIASGAVETAMVNANVLTGQTAETSIADDDLVLVYDTSATALRKMTKANFVSGLSGATAADDISTGDAAVTIATSAGNITLDAQGDDTDIIFKGTDGGVDTTFLTLDGSAAGAATFNAGVTSGGALLPSAANTHALGSASAEWSDLYLGDFSVIYFGSDQDTKLTHVHDSGLKFELNSAGSNEPKFEFISNNAGNIGPSLSMFHDSSSPANNDVFSTIEFKTNNDADQSHVVCKIQAVTTNVTDGSESAEFRFLNSSAGSIQSSGNVIFTGGGIIQARGGFHSHVDGNGMIFGANSEITLNHVHNEGLALKHTATSDDKPVKLTLQTGETVIAVDDVVGSLDFQAPDASAGTDAILVCAGIEAVSEGTFSSSNNATKLSFKTAASEVAAEKMSLSSTGNLKILGDLILDDGGSIKEAGGTAALTIDASGNVTKIGQDSPSNGQFLKWDGSKAVWDAASGGGSATIPDVQVITADTSAAFASSGSNGDNERIYLVNNGSNARTVTLPAVSGNTGKKFQIKRLGTANVTIAVQSGETLETASNGTFVLSSQYSSVTLVCNASGTINGWYIV